MISIRKLRHRGIAFGVAAVAILGLGACAQTSSATPGGQFGSTEAISGNITMLTPIYEGAAGKELLEETLLPEFYAEYPNVHVDVDYTNYARLNEKLTTAVVSGLVPDVMMMGVGWVEAFAQRGVLANLSDSGITADDLAQTTTQSIVDAGLYDGNVYGVPIMLDARFGVARMDILRDAGYDHPPTTWAELVEMSEKLTVRDSSGVLQRAGFDMLTIEPRQMFETMLFSQGGDMFSADNQSQAVNSATSVKTLGKIVDLFQVSRVEDIGFASPNAATNPLINGRAAMGIAHNNVWTQAEKANPDILPDLQPFLIPTDPAGTTDATDPAASTGSMFVGGTLATVSKASDNPRAAQALVEFLASPGPALAANEQRGNVPALTALLDSDYAREDPLVAFAMQNLADAKREGGPSQWLGLRGEVAAPIQAAMLGQKTPQETLDGLAAVFQKKLDR